MVWFTSDGHFSHLNVIKYCARQFPLTPEGVQQMNEQMVERWNAVVAPDDIVYYLGDFSLRLEAMQQYTPRLNGYKILVMGNHDWPHPAHKKSKGVGQREMWTKKYMYWGWDEVHLEMQIRLDDGEDGILVRLYHMPYKDEEDVHQNHPNHRLKDDGIPLICGHVHERWKLRLSKGGTPQVNVGVDCHGMAPVSEEAVLNYFKHMVNGEYRGPELKRVMKELRREMHEGK